MVPRITVVCIVVECRERFLSCTRGCHVMYFFYFFFPPPPPSPPPSTLTTRRPSSIAPFSSMSQELFVSLSQLIEMAAAKGTEYDHVVIESSGISEPKSVRSVFQDAESFEMKLLDEVGGPALELIFRLLLRLSYVFLAGCWVDFFNLDFLILISVDLYVSNENVRCGFFVFLFLFSDIFDCFLPIDSWIDFDALVVWVFWCFFFKVFVDQFFGPFFVYTWYQGCLFFSRGGWRPIVVMFLCLSLVLCRLHLPLPASTCLLFATAITPPWMTSRALHEFSTDISSSLQALTDQKNQDTREIPPLCSLSAHILGFEACPSNYRVRIILYKNTHTAVVVDVV